MKKQTSCYLALVVCVLASVSHVALATNKYPIVLVHGLSGWGRDELLGFKYWGGLYGDYQEDLKKQGYQVYTAAVGPFASNWDRACELYAQIKGGQVDYGANHSKIHGHERFGRTFPGFFPQWGTVVNGKLQKIHLIGHSMGGQTIRVFTQLLNGGTTGSATEEDPASHPLFAGGKDWVHSVTTVSTPNQGSTMADGLTSVIDLIESAIGGIFSIAGVIGDDSKILYDIKFDQWGIKARQTGESLQQYVHRVLSSRLFAPGFKDISAYDLTTYGAKELNTWVKTLPNVYYYSYVTLDTFLTKNVLLQTIALPNPFSMTAVIQPLAVFIGSRYTSSLGFPDSWLSNDGLVNIPSQYSDGKGKIVDYNGRSVRGSWNRFDTLTYMDHLAIVGFKLLNNVYDIYKSHAGLVYDLPAHEALTARRLADSDDVHENPAEITDAILAARKELNKQQSQTTLSQCIATQDTTTKALCELYYKAVEQPATRRLRA